MRIDTFDGFRGFFLLMMMVIHANHTLDTTLGRLNHHYFGFVQDAQGFIFVSGFIVALVYGKLHLKGGDYKQAILKRIKTIWTYQAGLIIIMLVTALAISNSAEIPALMHYAREPLWFTLSSLLLVSASMHMGILPLYIYYMAVLVFVLPHLSRPYWALVLFVSASVWILGQTQVASLVTNAAEDLLRSNGIQVRIGLFFNLLAWQIIFFVGAIIGYNFLRSDLPLGFIKSDMGATLGLSAFYVLVALGLLNRAVYWEWFGPEWSSWFLSTFVRKHFSIIHLFSAVVALYFISWLMLADLSRHNLVIRAIGRVVHSIVSFRPIVFLGQHSLQVFSFHILVVYFLEIVLHERTLPEWQATLVLIGCVMSLFIPARLHALHQERKLRRLQQAG